jgi:tetratricopeptide (TPR) repeat protein
VALRLAWFLEYRQSPFFDFIHLDPEYYVTWARGIAGGSWLGSEVFEQAPLYAYLLAGYMKIFGEGLEALRLIQFGVGAATAVMTGLLARRLLGRSAGLAAGLLAAIYGPFLFFEGQVMKEFLTPFFSVLVLLLFDRAVRGPGARRTWLLAAAGAAIGVAALVRDNILLVLPCLALCLPWMERADGDAAPPARPLRGAILLASGCLAVLLPVAARNYALSGDLVMTTSGGGEVFYIGNGPYANGAYIVPPWVRSSPRFEHEDFRKKARELAGRELTRAEASRFWWREGLRAILADPLRWVRLEARKGLLFINDHELPDNYSYGSFVRFSKILGFLPTFGLMAGLAAAGAVASAGLWRRLLPLYLAGGSYMISVMLFFNFGRFRLPFLPIVFVFAGGGLVALGRAALRAAHPAPGARRAIGGRAVAALAAGALVYLAALPDLHSSAEEPFQDRLHLGAAYRRAGMLDEAEEILRATIEDARGVLADRGWQPGSTLFPVGLSFAWSLHAAHRDLAGVLLDRGRSTEAIEEMRAAIPLDPNDAGLYQMLGGALLGEGESAAAERALRSAVRLRPDSFTARFDLATAIFEQGRAGEALAGLEEARRRSPGLEGLDLADWHYGMGTILFSIPGREGEAVAHFREALDLNPSHHQAGEARAIVSGER